MNKLSTEERAKIVACMVEGNSLRATCRMTGFAKKTVSRLLVEMGAACSAYQDRVFRDLKCKRLQADEIWAFVGAKEKNATTEQKGMGWGDAWTWTAIDADTKLVPCWFVGPRNADSAYHFMHDLAGRLAHRVQLTTDGHHAYISAVDDVFGNDIDYGRLVKLYGNLPTGPQTRYSPAICMGARKTTMTGKPDRKHISTSFAERQNLSMRMGMRRFTRLTNAFSKKLENHEHALAIYFMHYNFCRIHQTLRVTPAMEAGVAQHVWSLEEMVGILCAGTISK